MNLFINIINYKSVPLASAMKPGMIIRTRANILIKVNVTCVREAIVTLQQFTATTNALKEKKSIKISCLYCTYMCELYVCCYKDVE